MAVRVGKARSPWAVLGLTILTLGLYRYLWVNRAFGELSGHRGWGLRTVPWVPILFGFYLAGWGLSVASLLVDGIPKGGGASVWKTGGAPRPTLLGISGAVVGAVGALLWGWFLWGATVMAREAAHDAATAHVPRPGLVIAFTALGVASVVPYVGIVALLAGLVVFLVWLFTTQWAINEYWRGATSSRAGAASGPRGTG